MECPRCGKRMGTYSFAEGTEYREEWWECGACKLRLVPIRDDLEITKHVRYRP